MASPWKFLVRLVSPRRQQKQDDGSLNDETPDTLAIAGLAKASPEGGLSAAETSAREEALPLIQSEPVSIEPVLPAKGGSDRQGTGASDSDAGPETSDLALPDAGATLPYAASRVGETAKAEPAKRRGRAKTIKVLAVVSQVSPSVPIVSDEMGLDEEIRVLREKLASKLRLQNAQLRQKLKRFER